MRSRLPILLFVVAFCLHPRPASAGVWDTFVTWLSELDPKSGGVTGAYGYDFLKDSKTPPPPCGVPHTVTGNAGILWGKVGDDTLKIFPVSGLVVFQCPGNVDIAVGAGNLTVANAPAAGAPPNKTLNKPILVMQVTAPLSKNFGLRGGAMYTLKGFNAGDFGPGSTGGREWILMIGIGYRSK